MPQLVGQHCGGRVRVLDRKGPAKAAAFRRLRQLEQLDPIDRAQESDRLVADAQQSLGVAGRMEGDPVRKASAEIGDSEDIDKQLAQLVGPLADLLHGPQQTLIAGALSQLRVLVAHHRCA